MLYQQPLFIFIFISFSPQIVINLAARSTYATLNELIILAEHHPASASQQTFATLPETLIVAEEESNKVFEFDEVGTDLFVFGNRFDHRMIGKDPFYRDAVADKLMKK